MAKQEAAETGESSKNFESASSADNSGSADSTYVQIVRYRARPPAKFSSKTDWELWINMRFDAYAEEASIADIDRRGKVPVLLSLLDDEPNGLVETEDFKAVRDCLQSET